MEFLTKLALNLCEVLVVPIRLVITDYDSEKLFKLRRGGELRVAPQYLLVLHIIVQEVVGSLRAELVVQSLDVVSPVKLSRAAFKSKGAVTRVTL